MNATETQKHKNLSMILCACGLAANKKEHGFT
jgi:CDGSH-type Zn-finger protein